MTSSYIRNGKLRSDRRRVVVTLSLSLLVASSLIPAAAQVGNQKRITSVWTATSAEGSRVHVDSDSPINDYAGYTRGDRFYLTIPLADLPLARGSLLGRGFDDVQIQRYGDGIIISFHLQPGTTARVAQISNRLEVVFSTPGRYQSAASGIGNAEAENRTRVRRIGAVAGPAPESTTAKSSPRRSSGNNSLRAENGQDSSATAQRTGKTTIPRVRSGNSDQSSGSKPSHDGPTSTSKPSPQPSPSQAPTPRSAGSSASATPAGSKGAPSPSPSPAASASPNASPTSTSVVSLTSASPNGTSVSTATPAAPLAPLSTASPTTASKSGDNDWPTRLHYWKLWAELNWLPLLIGGLIVLCLLVLLLASRGAKHRRKATSEPGPESAKREAPSVTVATRASAPPSQASASRDSEAAAAPNSSQPSPAEQYGHGGEDQEREVFEL